MLIAISIENKDFDNYLKVVNFIKHLPLYELYTLNAETIKTYKKYPANDARKYVMDYFLAKNSKDDLKLEERIFQSKLVNCSKKKIKEYIELAYDLFPVKIVLGTEKHRDLNLQDTYHKYELLFFKKSNGDLTGTRTPDLLRDRQAF